MFVISACRIRTERGDAAAVGHFDCLRPPGARRTVRFSGQPFLDMPAIDRWIFRLLAELGDFPQQRSGCGIVLLEFAANPREAIPSPHDAIVRLTERIFSAGQGEGVNNGLWWLVCFSHDADAWG